MNTALRCKGSNTLQLASTFFAEQNQFSLDIWNDKNKHITIYLDLKQLQSWECIISLHDTLTHINPQPENRVVKGGVIFPTKCWYVPNTNIQIIVKCKLSFKGTPTQKIEICYFILHINTVIIWYFFSQNIISMLHNSTQ